MKFIIVIILISFWCQSTNAQKICANIEGPKHSYSDSIVSLKIKLNKFECKGKLYYSVNDSLLSNPIELDVDKNSAQLEFKASSFPGMHSVYFTYKCKKATHKFNYVYAVSPVFKEEVKIFELPDKINLGEKFIVNIINMMDGEFKLMCESCQSVEYLYGSSYELLISQKGEHTIWIEEKINGALEESYSRDIIIE